MRTGQTAGCPNVGGGTEGGRGQENNYEGGRRHSRQVRYPGDFEGGSVSGYKDSDQQRHQSPNKSLFGL